MGVPIPEMWVSDLVLELAKAGLVLVLYFLIGVLTVDVSTCKLVLVRVLLRCQAYSSGVFYFLWGYHPDDRLNSNALM